MGAATGSCEYSNALRVSAKVVNLLASSAFISLWGNSAPNIQRWHKLLVSPPFRQNRYYNYTVVAAQGFLIRAEQWGDSISAHPVGPVTSRGHHLAAREKEHLKKGNLSPLYQPFNPQPLGLHLVAQPIGLYITGGWPECRSVFSLSSYYLPRKHYGARSGQNTSLQISNAFRLFIPAQK